MLDTDLGQIILALTDAAQEEAPQAALLHVLAASLRADAGSFWLDGAEWRLGANGPAPAPLPDSLHLARLGRVYGPDDWPLRGQPLPPRGEGRALGVAVEGSAVWVALIRTRGTMRALDTARLSAIAPHLAQAVTLAQHLRDARTKAQARALALRRLSVGILHLDRTRGPLPDADATTQALLAAHGLSLHDLARRWPWADSETLTEVAQDLDLVTIPDGDGIRALGLLRPRRGRLPSPAALAQALGLTLSEARLAHSLARHTTLDQTARALGLTDATARFYTKQIFAKTGCSGQPALMQRIWASALLLLR
ncbi:MAG: helix-turn-helix transcriptional regulator [Roseinatronobacter sp.]